MGYFEVFGLQGLGLGPKMTWVCFFLCAIPSSKWVRLVRVCAKGTMSLALSWELGSPVVSQHLFSREHIHISNLPFPKNLKVPLCVEVSFFPGMSLNGPGMSPNQPGIALNQCGMSWNQHGLSQKHSGIAPNHPRMVSNHPRMSQNHPGMSPNNLECLPITVLLYCIYCTIITVLYIL